MSCIKSQRLYQLITAITRPLTQIGSAIDLKITNSNLVSSHSVLGDMISDLFSIFVIEKKKEVKKESVNKTIRD